MELSQQNGSQQKPKVNDIESNHKSAVSKPPLSVKSGASKLTSVSKMIARATNQAGERPSSTVSRVRSNQSKANLAKDLNEIL